MILDSDRHHIHGRQTRLLQLIWPNTTQLSTLALRDDSDRQMLDKAFDPTSRIPLTPTGTMPRWDYPRTDLVALVREKRKAEKFRKKKYSHPHYKRGSVAAPSPEAQITTSSDTGFLPRSPARLKSINDHLHPSACSSRRNTRELNDAHVHPSPALKKRSPSGYSVPRIFMPLSPFDHFCLRR